MIEENKIAVVGKFVGRIETETADVKNHVSENFDLDRQFSGGSNILEA